MHIVRWRFIKRSKNTCKILTGKPFIQKVDKAQSPIEEKQGDGKETFAPETSTVVLYDFLRQCVDTEKDLNHSKKHRHQIGDAQRSSPDINTGGYAVGQEWIRKTGARQDRIVRRKNLLVGNTCDKSKVHVHITKGTLTAVHGTVNIRDRAAQKYDVYKKKQGDQEKEDRIILKYRFHVQLDFSSIQRGAAFAPDGDDPYEGDKSKKGKKMCPDGEMKEKGVECWQPVQGKTSQNTSQ